MKVLADNDRGYLWNEGNETLQDSTVPDASKFRVGAPYLDGESGGGGAYSFDVLEHPEDPRGRRIEAVVMVGGMNQQKGGELGICCLKEGAEISDENQIKVVEFRASGIEFKVPITAPNLGGNLPAAITSTMWAPNGLSFTQQQSDANFVTYVTSVAWSNAPEHVKAVWSAWTGKL